MERSQSQALVLRCTGKIAARRPIDLLRAVLLVLLDRLLNLLGLLCE